MPRVEPRDPVRPQRHLHVLPLPPLATSTRGSRGLPQSQCPSFPVVTVCALVQLLPAPPLQRCTSEPGAGELGECLPGWGCGGRGGRFLLQGSITPSDDASSKGVWGQARLTGGYGVSSAKAVPVQGMGCALWGLSHPWGWKLRGDSPEGWPWHCPPGLHGGTRPCSPRGTLAGSRGAAGNGAVSLPRFSIRSVPCRRRGAAWPGPQVAAEAEAGARALGQQRM